MDLLDYVEMESLEDGPEEDCGTGRDGRLPQPDPDLRRHFHLYPQGGELGKDRAGPADPGGV